MDAKLKVVPLEWEKECNIIVGQSHFIKTVEDICEIMAGYVPQAAYGLAFSEASGPCLIRSQGNDEALVREAELCAEKVAAGHTFYLIMRNAFPINVLNQIKQCQEVCRIFAATANPLQIVTATTEQGGGIIGVIDGYAPQGIEGKKDKEERHAIVRRFGYKY